VPNFGNRKIDDFPETLYPKISFLCNINVFLLRRTIWDSQNGTDFRLLCVCVWCMQKSLHRNNLRNFLVVSGGFNVSRYRDLYACRFYELKSHCVTMVTMTT
jgi:hypothetical protein